MSSKYKVDQEVYSYYNTREGQRGILTAVCTKGTIGKVYHLWHANCRGEEYQYAVEYFNPKHHKTLNAFRFESQIFESKEKCEKYVENLNKARGIKRQAREYIKEALNE